MRSATGGRSPDATSAANWGASLNEVGFLLSSVIISGPSRVPISDAPMPALPDPAGSDGEDGAAGAAGGAGSSAELQAVNAIARTSMSTMPQTILVFMGTSSLKNPITVFLALRRVTACH